MQQYLIGAVVGFVMAIAVTWIGSAPPSVAQTQAPPFSKPFAECLLKHVGKAHVDLAMQAVYEACRSIAGPN